MCMGGGAPDAPELPPLPQPKVTPQTAVSKERAGVAPQQASREKLRQAQAPQPSFLTDNPLEPRS